MYCTKSFLRARIYSFIVFCCLAGSTITHAQTWQPLGPNDDNCSSFYGITNLTFDVSNAPYIVTQNTEGKALVRKYDGNRWSDVGMSGFSVGKIAYGHIEMGIDGRLYVIYRDLANSNKATVKKYDGNNWVDLGNPGFSAGEVGSPSIVIDGNNVPYVAYRDGHFPTMMVVKKYSGGVWTDVGTLGEMAGSINNPAAIAIDGNNNLYVAFRKNVSNSVGRLTVKKYDGTSWIDMGNDLLGVSVIGISLVVDPSGIPYVAYCDSSAAFRATVKKYNGIEWSTVGQAGFSEATIYNVSLARDNNGILYAYYKINNSGLSVVKKYQANSWINVGLPFLASSSVCVIGIASNGNVYVATEDGSSSGNPSNGTQLKKFNGSTWEIVGTSGFSSERPRNTAFAISRSGVPYVIYNDESDTSKARLQKYDGHNWIDAAQPGFTAKYANSPIVKINDNDVPFIAYGDYNYGSKATVKKLDGTNWVIVGSPGFSLGGVAYSSMAIDGAGTIYLAYADVPGGAGGRLSVKKYNGVNWVDVGTPRFSNLSVFYTSLAIDHNDVPYVIYNEPDNRIIVKKYNGANWLDVGIVGFSVSNSISPYNSNITIDKNNTPYIIYSDADNNGKATIKKYNGSNWISVGSAGISNGTVRYCSILFDQRNVPYISYQDAGNSNKAVVKRFDGNSWINIGSAASEGPANYLSMTVTTSGIPVIGYSNSYVFAKAFISPLNLGLLKAEKTPESTVKLNWNTYDERGISYFDVRHSVNNTDFVSIGRVNAKSAMGILTDSNNYQFIHTAPKKGNNYYRVKAVGFYSYEKLSNTALVNFDADFLASVFPNPLTDQSFLSVYVSQQSAISIRLLDMTGKLLWQANNVSLNQGSNRLNVPFTNRPHSIYLLEASLPSGERHTIRLLK